MSLLANVNNSLSKPSAQLVQQLARRQSGVARYRQPIAVVGPGDGRAKECLAAYAFAHCMGLAGMHIVCGGRGGVMEAASQGVTDAGGVAIGLLPEDDLRAANPYLTIALPTGMGEMRNALIARSCVCLVAIGGGMGTLSEMALGLKWNKPVFAMHEEVSLPDVQSVRHVDALIQRVLEWLVNHPSEPS
jgi:uncharacterized protein (TIGR00725 family)